MKNTAYLALVAIALLALTCKHKIPEPSNTNTTSTSTSTTGNTTTGGTTTGTIENKKDSVCFEQEIAPLLNSNCASQDGCHNATDKKAGINLTTYQSVTRTISEKNLLEVISEKKAKDRMPPAPNASLTPTQIALISKWIDEKMQPGIDCTPVCDTTDITYSGAVLPIIQNACFGCHAVYSPVFANYDQLKPLVDNGKFACSISHGNGCKPMPKNGEKLSACKQKLIIKWIEAGAKNN